MFNYGADLNGNIQVYFDVMIANKANAVCRGVSQSRWEFVSLSHKTAPGAAIKTFFSVTCWYVRHQHEVSRILSYLVQNSVGISVL